MAAPTGKAAACKGKSGIVTHFTVEHQRRRVPPHTAIATGSHLDTGIAGARLFGREQDKRFKGRGEITAKRVYGEVRSGKFSRLMMIK